MRGDEIRLHLAAGREDQAELEQAFAARLPFRHRREFRATHFKSSHDTSPFFVPVPVGRFDLRAPVRR
jgi:hypothetical protein